MKISIIGTGRMGVGLATLMDIFMSGEELLWGSRSISKAKHLVDAGALKQTRAVNMEQALEADVVVPTLWFRDLIPWVTKHEKQLCGKIVIDIVNPFTEDFSDFTLQWGTSAAEELQRALPDTTIIGAFKNTFFKVLANPIFQNQQSDVYVTGDDEQAKLTVMQLLEAVPFRILDGGRLANNRTIERMTLFEREIAIRYGNYPYVSNRMFGLNK
ncbi:NADPH-dependent F420 reductase [Paenibacillus hexagrammi]|uniref:NAD(P)-binding domain-containing protein n=1 Tax=Paenibacillus hexagrammi TaxID=2908839 RepID=A0ABY3SBI2_9BACL|nr:NAD(P)-binding domain-containing protein [Paenibacillus sp. YPD9-1]UJF31304.1 NAD(P)-binding domain-containing protein [Paenibacillus sp. YPD9-1]